MLETAYAALRFAASVALGAPFQRRGIDRLLAAMRAASDEFGPMDDTGDLLGGPELDETARRTVQGRRLRAQAIRAAQTPYYAGVFAAAGVDPASLRYESLTTIPVTPKQALRETPDAFVRAGARPAHRCTTTGTTARATAVWFSDDEVHAFNALSAVAAFQSRTVGPDDQVLIAVSARNALGVWALSAAATAVGATVALNGMQDPVLTLAALAEHRPVAGYKPRISVISITPSYLGQLVEHAPTAGYRPGDFGLERVLIGGEVLSDGLRERAQRVFGPIEIDETYAMTELMPFGAGRCLAGHLHYEPTICLVEVLGLDDAQPVAAGGVGTLVGTPLPPFRDTTPLLRYDTEDVVRTVDGPLSCELRRLPAIADVLGRRRLAVRHDAGYTFPADLVRALESVDAVPLPARYGCRPAGPGVALDVLVRGDSPTVRAQVGDALAQHGVPLVDLRLVEDAGLLRSPAPLRCDLREADVSPRALASASLPSESSLS
jgi:phenylacetate-coenzyme A ligase PaaK-like adenylate-forming protein